MGLGLFLQNLGLFKVIRYEHDGQEIKLSLDELAGMNPVRLKTEAKLHEQLWMYL